MSAQKFTFSVGAGSVTRLPAGRYFMILAATSAIDVTAEGNPGSPLRFIGIGAGTKFGPVGEGEGWRQLLISSAGAQNLEVVISDDGLFDLANTVTIAGVPNVSIQPASAIASPAADVITTGAALAVGANLSRKVITISSLSTGTGSVFIQATGAGAGRGIELQPGQSVALTNTSAFDVRNDSGVSVTVMRFEET